MMMQLGEITQGNYVKKDKKSVGMSEKMLVLETSAE